MVGRFFHCSPRNLGAVVLGLMALLGVTGQIFAQTQAPARGDFASLAAKADAARDGDQLDEAVTLYRKALAQRPGWKEGWWSLGTILYDQNSFSAAAGAFRRLVSEDPANGTAYLMLGLCEYELGLDDPALRHIEEAKKLGTHKDEQLVHVLHYHEAILLLRKGHFDRAMDALTFLVNDRVHSDELSAALGMGALLLLPKDAPPEATAGHEVLLRVGEAERMRVEKKYDDSAKAYADLAQKFPDFPNIHYAYGRVLLLVQNSEAAIAQFQQEIRNNPEHVRARLQIASAYYRTDSRAGIPFAEEAVKLQPKYPFGHYLLGLLYFDTGDTARAIPQLEGAVRMVPQEPQFYFALGNAYAKAGRKQEAARARASFMRLKHGEGPEPGPSTYGEAHNPDPARLESSAPQP